MIIRFIPSFYNIQNPQNNIQRMNETTVTEDEENPENQNIKTKDENKVSVKRPEDEE